MFYGVVGRILNAVARKDMFDLITMFFLIDIVGCGPVLARSAAESLSDKRFACLDSCMLRKRWSDVVVFLGCRCLRVFQTRDKRQQIEEIFF